MSLKFNILCRLQSAIPTGSKASLHLLLFYEIILLANMVSFAFNIYVSYQFLRVLKEQMFEKETVMIQMLEYVLNLILIFNSNMFGHFILSRVFMGVIV